MSSRGFKFIVLMYYNTILLLHNKRMNVCSMNTLQAILVHKVKVVIHNLDVHVLASQFSINIINSASIWRLSVNI